MATPPVLRMKPGPGQSESERPQVDAGMGPGLGDRSIIEACSGCSKSRHMMGDRGQSRPGETRAHGLIAPQGRVLRRPFYYSQSVHM